MRLNGKKLMIRPYVYRIRSNQETREALAVANANGAHLGDDALILIDPVLDSEVQVDTLFHESLHAIWRQSGFLSIEYPDIGQDSVGEKLIQEITPRVISLLRDNSWFVRFVLGSESR